VESIPATNYATREWGTIVDATYVCKRCGEHIDGSRIPLLEFSADGKYVCPKCRGLITQEIKVCPSCGQQMATNLYGTGLWCPRCQKEPHETA